MQIKKRQTNDLAAKNHRKYLERKNLFLSFGYDAEKEKSRILEYAEPFKGKILEVGTGKGYFALTLAGKGYRFTTVDISKEEQEIAKLNLQYFKLDHLVHFVVENGECLSFKNESFDVIFFLNTLHHLTHPIQVIDELIRVLAPSGKLVLSDFNDEGFAVMDKIHALEGRVHETGKIRLSGVETYLISKQFSVDKKTASFDDLLIAVKQP